VLVGGGRVELSRESNEEGVDARSAMTVVPHEFRRVMRGAGCGGGA